MDEQAEQDAVKKSAQLLQGISEAIHDERCYQPACSMRLSLRLRSIKFVTSAQFTLAAAGGQGLEVCPSRAHHWLGPEPIEPPSV